ncbi:MAG: ATP-binding cassette domain-containing protein [Oliverpabstia sp.]
MGKNQKERKLFVKLVRMTWDNAKGLVIASLLREVIQVVNPYVVLLFGAEITNLLIAGSYDRAVELVVWMSIFLLCMKCTENICTGLENKWSIALELYMQSNMNQVCYASDLEVLESYEFQQNYQRAKDGLEYSGGMYAFICCCETILADVLRIVITVAFLTNLILKANSWTGRGMIVALAGLIVGCSFLRVLNNRKTFEAASRFYEKLVPYNNQLQYFFYELCADQTIGKDIRTYHLENMISGKEEVSHREVLGFLKKIMKASSKYHALNAMLEGFLWGVTYLLVTLCCLAERLGLGDILKYVGIVNQVSQAFSSILNASADVRFKLNFLEGYLAFVKSCPKEEKRLGTLKNQDVQGDICCSHVSYQYSGTDTMALCDVSLKIEKGSQVAIVGENGSGKSTLLKVLMGLYTPKGGSVTVFGEKQYREMDYFAPVFQDFTIFPITVEQNLTFSINHDEEKRKVVWKVLEKLDLKQKVEKLHLGIDTVIRWNESGQVSRMSGGEEQKIALARAIFTQRPIYVLDEPSAALDIKSELTLYKLFRELTEDKTVIFVSHRLFSCRQCDKIFVMDHGKLVQEGTHEQLVKVQGKYREMWESQIRDFLH